MKNKFYLINKILKEKNLYYFSNLRIDQPIVHFEHGIGRYKGLITIITKNIKTEYLVIRYANNTKLYVPISYLYLISQYIGSSSKKKAPLHKLGTDTWRKEQNKAHKKAYNTALMLIKIYAQRDLNKGFSFQHNHKKYNKFCKTFPFKLTPDQENAINSVFRDMHKSIPMDRLICGDVGFGKTEIAMRAAFLAICNKKQVVILVPTTLLAQQHFNNFKLRFKFWSIKIAILSRLQSSNECYKIINSINSGTIHILIGTHKILLHNLKWKNLGLLIIDEEHRFGVCHKEQIKLVCSNIDVLTLTATPIPRTLNMAMMGIKDLSIISTPPKKRLITKTFVREFSYILVRKAIIKEILRGGQVYYVYNNVEKIKNKEKKLKEFIPEAKIKVGHGQLKGSDLESIMNDFYHQRFNVLVCTTIIETGIDIPNVNTIIIENANHFGLTQLHQLRGRVGRSQNQAYAWLFVSSSKNMTSNGKKRIETISSLNNLSSSGFALSNYDLEMRGIGEILGNNQSGHILNVGFSLYLQLLQKSIKNIKYKKNNIFKQLKNNQPKIELNVSNLLPENYVKNVNQRLLFYSKIAYSNDLFDLDTIQLELIKNFGNLPKQGIYLIKIAKIRLIAKKIGIKKLKSNNQNGYIDFKKKNMINIKLLLKKFNEETHFWKFDSETRLKFSKYFINSDIRINWILNMIMYLHDYPNNLYT